MSLIYLFFAIADLCAVYCTQCMVQLAHTADAKLESFQSKGSCWIWIWFLFRVSITYWLLQYLGGILIKQLIGK